PLGKGLSLVKKGDSAPAKGRERLFLHVNCPDAGKVYLAVYRASGPKEYAFQEAYPAPEGFFRDGEASGPAVEGFRLTGRAKCPWCGAERRFFCSNCRKVYCSQGKPSFYCPGCEKTYKCGSASVLAFTPSQG
ncbi:MAG: hypothetical protein LBQ12_10255, partial [Deltaproteobacteria bacterium]|nr:hypothetical protein [Deltaproteobacteria bacterium]